MPYYLSSEYCKHMVGGCKTALKQGKGNITVYYLLGKALAKEVMFLVALVCLFVCLSVCGQHFSKSYKQIGMKFY